MMNQEEFNSHNESELYRIYVDLFKKVGEDFVCYFGKSIFA